MRNTHLPTAPGAIIGYRRNGCPIRLIGGGAPEDDDQGSDGQDGGTGAGDSQDGQDGQEGGDQQGSGGDGQAGDHDPGPEGTGGHQDARAGDDSAARTIAALRGDFKTERKRRQDLERDLAAIKQAQADQAQATDKRNKDLAKALGLVGDEPPDPAQLGRDLEAARKATQDAINASNSRERALVVENALLKQARRHGADPELLADSRSFMSTLGSLDPSSEDFGDDLGDAIKTAVERTPSFKVAAPATAGNGQDGGGAGDGAGSGDSGNGQRNGRTGARTTAPPARSGTGEGHNGAAAGNRQWTREDVGRASPAEVKEALDAGLLTGLGMNPKKKR